MSKISRYTQKIFGINNASDLTQFGSAAAGSRVTTSDVGVIQSLSAWGNGWRSALVSYIASLQDQNSVNYVLSSQVANILQDGIPIYDSGTTYYTGCIVRADTTSILYKSSADNNTGNSLSNTSYWTLLGDLANLPSSTSSGWLSTAISVSGNVIYQAATNGFLMVSASYDNASSNTIGVLSDSNSTPTTAVGGGGVYCAVQWDGSTGWMWIPINKNNYYKVIVGGSALSSAKFYPVTV